MSGHNAKHNVILGWILAVLVFIVSSLFSVAGIAQKMPATVGGTPLKGVNVNRGKKSWREPDCPYDYRRRRQLQLGRCRCRFVYSCLGKTKRRRRF